jgi:uncharacterized protein (TIGR03435 family)
MQDSDVIILTMFVTNGLFAGVLVFSACYAQAPARLEFEAASVKPSTPPGGFATSMYCRGGPGTADPGFYRCENWSLSNLINVAYLLGPNQLSAPDWINRAIFDITAKVPAGATHEQFQVMLQNLLADRFKLAIHHETRESTEYRLTVAKGGVKFKPAPPKEESSADATQEPPTPKPFHFDADGYPVFAPGESGTKNTYKGRSRMYEPRMTMAWLAGMLSGSLHGTVTDATGLAGEYEISLYWILDSAMQDGSADDASGPTLVQAVQKELGLRLEKTANGTKDILVVDHAEKVPTGN